MAGDSFTKCSCRCCGNHIEFPISAAGMSLACPHCGESTELVLEGRSPEAPLAAYVEEPEQDAGDAEDEILVALEGAIRPRGVSLLYQLGLVLVGAVMVLLPVLYVVMIGAAGWGVYLYAMEFSWLLQSGGGVRLALLKWLGYLGPIFIGAVLVFFMVKPLFARRAPQAQPLALNPEIEPLLFAFINCICRSIRAPMPRRIELDCHLNAAAGFRRGLRSFVGNDLVLTLGLPLAAGLDLRELAGVIAHEFGHFTQGFGMRISYVIRSVNGWFARVVYERDAWDVMLEQWAADAENVYSVILVAATRLSVWVSRLVLMLLMFLGHGVSCFLLRQMEYDADSYEIKLAGTEGFESTTRRIRILEAAARRAYQELRRTLQTRGALPRSFPLYLVEQEAQLPPEVKQRVLDRLGLVRTKLFDTHPSDADRIRQARRAAEPGVFHLRQPATRLFSNFEAVSEQVTLLHYADDLGLHAPVADGFRA